MTEPELIAQFAALDPFQECAPIFVSDPFSGKSERDWQRLAERYVPAGYTTIHEHPERLGIVYSGESNGKHFAIAYAGNAGKSAWHYSFKSPERLQLEIDQFFTGLTQHKAIVEQRRRADNAGHTLKRGDIITNSWGYDQTNVDWYRIVRTTRNFVWLQPICAVITTGTGALSGRCEPDIDTTSPDPMKWDVRPTGEPITKHKASGQTVTMKFGCGSKWDGATLHCSWSH